jgi:hypothetical protein
VFGQQLGRVPVREDASDEICIAVFLLARDFSVPEMNVKHIVVVVALTVAGEVSAQCLNNDNLAAVDNACRDSRPLNKDAVQWPKISSMLGTNRLSCLRAPGVFGSIECCIGSNRYDYLAVFLVRQSGQYLL